MSTKKQAAVFRAFDWKKALHEKRVVRYLDGSRLRAFPNVKDAEAFLEVVKQSGDATAHIITGFQ
jgi:hypothetical protein